MSYSACLIGINIVCPIEWVYAILGRVKDGFSPILDKVKDGRWLINHKRVWTQDPIGLDLVGWECSNFRAY